MNIKNAYNNLAKKKKKKRREEEGINHNDVKGCHGNITV